MRLYGLLIANTGVLILALIGGYQVGAFLAGETVRHSAAYRPDSGAPVVSRHPGEVHIVLDDGTLFVIPTTGCVVIVRADETDGTCLES